MKKSILIAMLMGIAVNTAMADTSTMNTNTDASAGSGTSVSTGVNANVNSTQKTNSNTAMNSNTNSNSDIYARNGDGNMGSRRHWYNPISWFRHSNASVNTSTSTTAY